MAEQYIYQVARVRSHELSLLSESVMAQLSGAAGEEECLRILQERGWSAAGSDPEKMLAAEREKTWDFIRELLPESQIKVFDVFLLADDYHNLKAAVKEVCIGGTHPGIFVKNGTVDPEKIREAVASSDYESLPESMRSAAQQAKELLLKTRDGQLCDITIDRAALSAIRKAGKDTGEKLLEDYGELICATGDIKIAVRAAGVGKDRAFLKRALAPCGSLDVDLLADAASDGADAVCAYLSQTEYADAVEQIQKGLADFERWCDDRMIERIRPEIHNPFGIGPLAAYILARESEIRTVRIILAAKRNGLPEEAIRERVRETYV